MAVTMLRDTQALGNSSVRMSGSENEWGFGQFLPVLLLALPIFAGWESFWEEKDKDKKIDRFGRRNDRASRSDTGLLDVEKGVQGRRGPGMGTGMGPEVRMEVGLGLGTPRVGESNGSIKSWPLPEPDRLTVPSPAASPRLGVIAGGQKRPRTPSRFEEDLS